MKPLKILTLTLLAITLACTTCLALASPTNKDRDGISYSMGYVIGEVSRPEVSKIYRDFGLSSVDGAKLIKGFSDAIDGKDMRIGLKRVLSEFKDNKNNVKIAGVSYIGGYSLGHGVTHSKLAKLLNDDTLNKDKFISGFDDGFNVREPVVDKDKIRQMIDTLATKTMNEKNKGIQAFIDRESAAHNF